MLRYEVGFGVQYKDELGQTQTKSFDHAEELLEAKIEEICEGAFTDEEPVFYLTGDERLRGKLNRRRVKEGKEELPSRPNFREQIAVTKPYKGQRKSAKPHHYDNLTAFILANYETKVAWGYEADDLLSIDHRLDPENTIICSRDKDLRITPGKHFGWTCGKQEQFGPMDIDELGFLELTDKGLKGGGLKFFYSQLITGDSVDNIPGLPGCGPMFAFKLLAGCEAESELFEGVSGAYREKIQEGWREYFQEQAHLLWMIQELTEDGEPVLYKMFDER